MGIHKLRHPRENKGLIKMGWFFKAWLDWQEEEGGQK